MTALLLALTLTLSLALADRPTDKYADPYSKWSYKSNGLPLKAYGRKFPVERLVPPIKID